MSLQKKNLHEVISSSRMWETRSLWKGFKILVWVKNVADEYYENDDIKESEFNGELIKF